MGKKERKIKVSHKYVALHLKGGHEVILNKIVYTVLLFPSLMPRFIKARNAVVVLQAYRALSRSIRGIAAAAQLTYSSKKCCKFATILTIL